jgi:hypothetical protein
MDAVHCFAFWCPAIYRTQKTQKFQKLINAKSLRTQKFSSSHTQCEQLAGGLIIWITVDCSFHHATAQHNPNPAQSKIVQPKIYLNFSPAVGAPPA